MGMDRVASRLIEAWRGRRRGARVLDAWTGETVKLEGRRFFRRPDGLLAPAVSGLSHLWRSQREWMARTNEWGGAQGWEEMLDSIVADGTAVTAAAITIVCPDFNIPAYYMAPGRVLRIYAAGTNNTVVTTPGTGVWGVSWGGVAGVVLAKSAAQGFHTTAQTLDGWNLTVIIVCRTSGATGTFMSSGQLNSFNILDTTSANLKAAVMGSSGPNSNVSVTVDTTIAKLLSVTFTQTVATGSLVCQQRLIEVLN